MQQLESAAYEYEDLYHLFLLHCPTEYKTCKKGAFKESFPSGKVGKLSSGVSQLCQECDFLELLFCPTVRRGRGDGGDRGNLGMAQLSSDF